MSDYTWMVIHIIDWGPHPDLVLQELSNYGFEEPDPDDTGRFVQEEGRVGYMDELIRTLPSTGVGAFYGWESPKYEWLGTYIAYTPTLGSYAAPCDDSGHVVLTWGELRDRNVPPSPSMDQAYGRPWDLEINQLQINRLLNRKGITP